ncbi:hypothetical protein EYF80_022947 [Liparis tanakae]|uniref:Uncharacterized protein n=1 Tax=Liparis tanakae TaxID=230148 RepID=A0A4Z2HLZ6_9TELE|nr:hypothetical protein EYF80_022947 [Liparis tanakae]
MIRAPTPSSSAEGTGEPLPPPEPEKDTAGSTPDEDDPPAAHAQAAKAPPRSEPGKMPKWLKLPGDHCSLSGNPGRSVLPGLSGRREPPWSLSSRRSSVWFCFPVRNRSVAVDEKTSHLTSRLKTEESSDPSLRSEEASTLWRGRST